MSTFLVGCGILQKEVDYLIRQNEYDLQTDFLESALHNNMKKLYNSLTTALDAHKNDETIVFYGCCHPLMDKVLENANTIRTEGQNCIEMLLGSERFEQEIESGAYFLLEDWANKWDEVVTQTFGNNIEVIREIFKSDRKYILAIRTPCSSDYEELAKKASEQVDLPLRWMDASLEHLNETLKNAMRAKGMAV